MAEATRTELDTRSKTKFRVAGKLGVRFAVMQKFFGRDITVEGRENVLCCYTVTCIGENRMSKLFQLGYKKHRTCFIKVNGDIAVGMGEKRFKNDDLWYGVVGTTSVARDSTSSTCYKTCSRRSCCVDVKASHHLSL